METRLRTTHRKKDIDLRIFSYLQQRQSMEWEYSQLVFVCRANFINLLRICQGIFERVFKKQRE